MDAIDVEKLNQLISRVDINGIDKVRWLTDFIDGRELQLIQERSYSEEDVKTAFLDGWQLRDGDLPFSKAMKKWFEQFKKK